MEYTIFSSSVYFMTLSVPQTTGPYHRFVFQMGEHDSQGISYNCSATLHLVV